MGRITVGFHRLGLALAIPLALAAAAPPLIQIFDPDGPPVPDPASRPNQKIIVAGELWASRDRADPRLFPGPLLKIYEIDFDTDGRKLTIRTPDEKLLAATLEDFSAEERRRGRLLEQKELPVLIGETVIEYRPENRMPTYTAAHLKRRFNAEWLWMSAGLLATAGIVYLTARITAWIIEGFVGDGRLNRP